MAIRQPMAAVALALLLVPACRSRLVDDASFDGTLAEAGGGASDLGVPLDLTIAPPELGRAAPDLTPATDLFVVDGLALDRSAADDLAATASDLAVVDLAATAPDLTVVVDLAVAADLATPDLVAPDLAVPADLIGADLRPSLPPIWPMQGGNALHHARGRFAGPSSLAWTSWGYTGNPTYDARIGADGTIYVLNYYEAAAVEPISGALIWQVKTKVFFDELAIGAAGTLYVSNFNSGQNSPEEIQALDPGDGHTRWSYFPAHGLSTTFVLAPDDTLYFAVDHQMLALGADGQVRWTSVGLDNYPFGPPTLGGGLLLIATQSTLYALDRASGGVQWSRSARWSQTAVAVDGTVYSREYGLPERLVARDPSDGHVRWTLDGADEPAIGADGTLYTCGNDTYMAIDPSGTIKWSYKPANITGFNCSQVVDANSTTYVFARWWDPQHAATRTARMIFTPDGKLVERRDGFEIERGLRLGVTGRLYMLTAGSNPSLFSFGP